MRTSRRGYNLVEIMVAACLLMLLMLGLHQLIRAGLHYYRLAQAGETAHQEALVGLRKVSFDVGESRRNLVAMGGSWVAFPSPTPPANRRPEWTYSFGLLEWHKWVAYYVDGTDLVRAEIDMGSPTVNPIAPPPLHDFRNRADAQKVVARGVAQFTPSDGVDPDLVELELRTQVETGTGKATEVTFRTQVRPAN